MQPALPRMLPVLALALGSLFCASEAAAAPAAAHRTQTGKASYYGVHSAGKTTASGAKFKPNRMVAASRTLPLGTKAKVTNLETGRSVGVTVEDRGPYAKGRILDVSPKAADKLDMKEDGVATVKVKPLKVPGRKAR